MIIDLILDRKHDEELIKQGYDKAVYPNGTEQNLKYKPHRFYRDIMGYRQCFPELADPIALAMDYGEEDDVKRELCNYVIENGYDNTICDYIVSVNWLN